MALGKLPVPGRPTIWMIVEQGPIALAEVAVGGCLDIFTLLYLFSPHSSPLWKTARYSLKYSLEGPWGWSGGAMVLGKLPVPGRPTIWITVGQGPTGGWSGGAMVLGKLPVSGRPTIWITVGQGPTALAVGAGGGCLDIFTLIYPFSPLSPSLWETARYRLKYCLKGPLNPKQPTNQGPTALAVGAGGGWFGHFYSQLSVLSLGLVGWCDGPG